MTKEDLEILGFTVIPNEKGLHAIIEVGDITYRILPFEEYYSLFRCNSKGEECRMWNFKILWDSNYPDEYLNDEND